MVNVEVKIVEYIKFSYKINRFGLNVKNSDVKAVDYSVFNLVIKMYKC